MDLVGADTIFHAAHVLARAGYLQDADALLQEIDESRVSLDTLLLRAKIRAQLGDKDGARTYWKAGLDRDPENAEAKAGLARIETHGTRSSSQAALLRSGYVVAAIGVCAVLVCGVALFGGVMGGRIVSASVIAASSAPIAILTERIEATRAILDGIATTANTNSDQVETLHRLIDVHHASLTDLGQSLVSLEHHAAELRQMQAAAAAEVERLREATDHGLNEVLARTDSRADAFEQHLGDIDATVKALRDFTTKQVTGIVKAVDDRNASLSSSVADFSAKMREQESHYERLLQASKEIAGQLTAMQTTLGKSTQEKNSRRSVPRP